MPIYSHRNTVMLPFWHFKNTSKTPHSHRNSILSTLPSRLSVLFLTDLLDCCNENYTTHNYGENSQLLKNSTIKKSSIQFGLFCSNLRGKVPDGYMKLSVLIFHWFLSSGDTCFNKGPKWSSPSKEIVCRALNFINQGGHISWKILNM